MALKIDTNMSATAFHITDGAVVFPYSVDAMHAISNHPLEWSDKPWSQQDAAAARQRLNERNKEEGLAPLPAPAPLSPEDQAALDAHNKAVDEAAKRLAAYHERKAEEKAEADQAAADEALVHSIPPQPDPTARKPLSPAQLRKQSATLTPAEEATRAANEKIASDKAETDRMGNAFKNTI